MTAGIKRMLAERAKLAEKSSRVATMFEPAYRPTPAEKAHQRAVDNLFALIDRAAPYIDEGTPPGQWPPSKSLKLLYCSTATCGIAGAKMRAFAAIENLLERSRRYWVMGLHPNPFWNEANGLPPERRAP